MHGGWEIWDAETPFTTTFHFSLLTFYVMVKHVGVLGVVACDVGLGDANKHACSSSGTRGSVFGWVL